MLNTGTAIWRSNCYFRGRFLLRTLDKLIRAFDSDTGKDYVHKLYIGSAPPTVYEAKGEQYIVIPATGGSSKRSDLLSGDAML